MTIWVAWYALGWVAMGLNFTLNDMKAPFFVCFVLPPLVIIGWMILKSPQLDFEGQYLWRKR